MGSFSILSLGFSHHLISDAIQEKLMMKKIVAPSVMGICLFLPIPLVFAEEAPPISFGGSLGYTYRVLDRPSSDSTVGNLLSLDLHGKTYLVQPWYGVVDGGLTLTKDGSETGPVQNTNDLVTGRMNLNLFPRSPFPFELQYHRTDTRIDTEAFALGNEILSAQDDFALQRTFIRQSLIPWSGLRLSATYDMTEADSLVGEDYSGKTLGGQFSWRMRSNNLTANFSDQSVTRSSDSGNEDNQIINVNHQFSPNSSFVITTLASDVHLESDDPTETGVVRKVNEQTQLFTNFYWRPESSSFLLNGGLRVTDFQDLSNGTVSNKQDAAAFSLSGLYQVSQNVNLNAAVSLYNSDNQTTERNGTDQRIGAVYRSDTYAWNRFTYNWFSDANFINSIVEDVNSNADSQSQTLSGSLGHTLQRRWILSQDSMFSLHFNERVTERLNRTDDQISLIEENESIEGLTHSISLQWSKLQKGANNAVRLSVSDTRDFEDQETIHDLVNFQLTRSQTLGRRASLNANIYYQYTRQVIGGTKSNVSTISGVANYTHSGLFRIPRLRFQSRFNITQPDEDKANRGLETYWDNRLDYSVGKLRSSLVVRFTGRDSSFYNALYLRLTRRF